MYPPPSDIETQQKGMQMPSWFAKKSTNAVTTKFPFAWAITFGVLLLIIAALYVTVLIAYITVTTNSNELTPSVLGQFGDFLGGFWNPILSIITIAGLFVTIVIQNMQLRDARFQILNEQETESKRTQREHFFQLLEIFRDVTSSISVNVKNGPARNGKMAFVTWHSFFISQCYGQIAKVTKLKRYVFKYTEEDALAIVAEAKNSIKEFAEILTEENPFQNVKKLEDRLGEDAFREFLLAGKKTRPLFMKKYWSEIGRTDKSEIVINASKIAFSKCNHTFGAYFKCIYQLLHFAVDAKRESEFFPIIKSQINVYEMEAIMANFACGYAKPDFIVLANKARILNDINLIQSLYTMVLISINDDLLEMAKK